MANDHGDDEREALIAGLKAQAAALGGGHMLSHVDEGLSPELREQFWRRVIETETAPTTDLLKELKALRVELPEPDGLDDMLGGCSPEDIALYLKYYADEEQREHWRRDSPDVAMPDHVDPPYDRDSRLPQAGWWR